MSHEVNLNITPAGAAVSKQSKDYSGTQNTECRISAEQAGECFLESVRRFVDRASSRATDLLLMTRAREWFPALLNEELKTD